MKLLADENLNCIITRDLRNAGHEVISISEDSPGIPDEQVLELANRHGALLLTGDKDFGEMAYRQKLVHHGVTLIRLAGLRTDEKSRILQKVLEMHGDELKKSFTVIAPNQIRIRKPQPSTDH
ncbi:DUF5615 family PIN-like protein [Akkermansiaceae bacterium]|nr:DUF5615 family PIN-like protein [Akkermansiaceae bacterium]